MRSCAPVLEMMQVCLVVMVVLIPPVARALGRIHLVDSSLVPVASRDGCDLLLLPARRAPAFRPRARIGRLSSDDDGSPCRSSGHWTECLGFQQRP
ncbi:hypothetical protein F5Y10DRAFT_232280 [Nemania abortiva]|nr:hypothetical protein F5Y10DRAFT_232280 [Nemania abortiva]